MMTYTTAEAAQILGVVRRTVTRHCRIVGIPKHGRDWLIDDDGLRRLRESIVGVVGNPNWGRLDKKDQGR